MSRRRASWVAAVAVAVITAAMAVTGCGARSSAAGGTVTELRYQGSVGQVTLPELASDLGYLGDLKLKWIGNTLLIGGILGAAVHYLKYGPRAEEGD